MDQKEVRTVTDLLRHAIHNHGKAVRRIRAEGHLPKHLKQPLLASFALVADYVWHLLRHYDECGPAAAKPERPSSQQLTMLSKTGSAGSSSSSPEP